MAHLERARRASRARVPRLDTALTAIVGWTTGRRGRFVVIGAWAVLAAVGFVLHGRLGEVTAAGQRSFLPRDAESTRALEAQQRRFGGGDDVPALLVFERDGPLTPSDRVVIGRLKARIDRLRLGAVSPSFGPFGTRGTENVLGVGLVARDRTAAIVALAIDADVRNAVTKDVERIRSLLPGVRRTGLQAHVAGPAGVAADLEQVADDAGRTLLVATLALVLVLLLVVYRAPLLAILPLTVVAAAYLVAAGIAYLLIRAGAITVNSEGTMLLLVLIFGAGTDYSLLLVQAYREQLAGGAECTPALRRGVVSCAPAILASGGTVIAALLVLLVADLESTRWLGPILAVGIAVMLTASFTLLPAVMSLLGPRCFWPRGRPEPEHRAAVWSRAVALIRRRGPLLIAITAVALVLAALGNLIPTGTIGFGQGQSAATDSSRGTDVLNRHFPPGLSSPVVVVAEARARGRIVRDLGRLAGVALVLPVKRRATRAPTSWRSCSTTTRTRRRPWTPSPGSAARHTTPTPVRSSAGSRPRTSTSRARTLRTRVSSCRSCSGSSWQSSCCCCARSSPRST